MTTEQTETAPETRATKRAAAGARRTNVAPPPRRRKRPGGPQNRHDTRTAEAARRSYGEGTAQGNRLAAEFPARLSVGDGSARKWG